MAAQSFPSTNSTDIESASPSVVAEDEVLADGDVSVIPRSGNKKTTATMRKLSTVSKMYDIDGDGKLDEAELAMRNMDESSRGHLTNEKVYKLMRQQLETQRQLFRTRRVMFVLLGLVVLLALSNLGTSFAAAHLAKDTTVSSNAELVDKSTGEALSTQTTEDSVEVERATVDSEGRRRLCNNGEDGVECDMDSSFLSLSKKDCKKLIHKCKRGNKVNGVRVWPNEDETVTSICPYTGTFSKFGRSVLKNEEGESFHLEQDDEGNCRISGDAFKQKEGRVCELDNDCAPGLSCQKEEALVVACKRHCARLRFSPHRVEQCKTSCEHPSCQRNAVEG